MGSTGKNHWKSFHWKTGKTSTGWVPLDEFHQIVSTGQVHWMGPLDGSTGWIPLGLAYPTAATNVKNFFYFKFWYINSSQIPAQSSIVLSWETKSSLLSLFSSFTSLWGPSNEGFNTRTRSQLAIRLEQFIQPFISDVIQISDTKWRCLNSKIT